MTPEMMLAKLLSNTAPEMVEKTASSVDGEPSVMRKLAMADEWGRELAREHMEKVAIPMPSMGALKSGIGQVAGKVMTTGAPTRAAVGAGVGAAAGGLKNPGYDAQGNQKSRLGGMVGGALAGAGAGVAAKAGVQALGSSNTAAGKYLGGAVTAAGKQQGHLGYAVAGKQMAQARGTTQRAAVAAKKAVPAAPAAGIATAPVA